MRNVSKSRQRSLTFPFVRPSLSGEGSDKSAGHKHQVRDRWVEVREEKVAIRANFAASRRAWA
jgi:hypothetical protein